MTRLPESGSSTERTSRMFAIRSGIKVVTKESLSPVAFKRKGASPTAVATRAIRQVPAVEGSSEKPRIESEDSRICQASSKVTGRLATIEIVPRTSSGTRIVRSVASPIFLTSSSIRARFWFTASVRPCAFAERIAKTPHPSTTRPPPSAPNEGTKTNARSVVRKKRKTARGGRRVTR